MTAEAARRRDLIRRLDFFDAGVWLGPPAGFPLAEELPAAHLGEAMQARFLSGALVSHWHGRTLSAQAGNAALQALEPQLGPRDFTIWTGLPPSAAGTGPLPGAGAPDRRMRGVRLFPKTHRFALTPEGVGSLCEWLVKARMPLFLWHVEIDWRELRELATTFARLNIVVETHTQKILYHSETLFDLMRDRGNVLVETSNFVGPGYVEYAVEHFGAERLLFGSFLPVNDPLVPMGMLLDADIPQEAKALIAGGNLRRLVDGMRR